MPQIRPIYIKHLGQGFGGRFREWCLRPESNRHALTDKGF